VGAWSSAFSLVRGGAVTSGFSIDAAARRRLPRIVAAALAMGGLLWLAASFALPLAADIHGVVQAVLLAVLISGAIAVYALLLALSGVIGRDQAASVVG